MKLFAVRILEILSIAFLFQLPLMANERKFAYTYETLTLPPGAREIETWSTYRTNKGYFYRRLDQRVEYEFGVSSNLMSALYLNYNTRVQDSNGDRDSGAAISDFDVSISNEWKYKISDRTADPVGIGLYGEVSLGLDEIELEGKILLDKQVGNLLLAFNAVGEHEWKTKFSSGKTGVSSEIVSEFDFGVSYSFSNNFGAGIEIRNHNVLEDGEIEHTALFGGPVLSYTAEGWWATLTLLPQWASLKRKTTGALDLQEYEKIQGRLLFSFHL